MVAQVQNREQTWLDFLTADPDGKNAKAIFRDQTAAWIESPGDPIFSGRFDIPVGQPPKWISASLSIQARRHDGEAVNRWRLGNPQLDRTR